jgi:hypothetical protein
VASSHEDRGAVVLVRVVLIICFVSRISELDTIHGAMGDVFLAIKKQDGLESGLNLIDLQGDRTHQLLNAALIGHCASTANRDLLFS